MRLLLFLALPACRCADGSTAPAGAAPAEASSGAPPDAHEVPGACEASALLAVDGRFLVGDNETPRSLFAMSTEGLALPGLPLAADIDDIEAMVADGDGIWVIGSQGRKKSGELDPERQRLLRWPGTDAMSPDLSGCPDCRDAAERPPEAGGVNVEGGFLWDGKLWLGLRSPLSAGRALLLELASTTGPRPSVSRTLGVDLGGFGVRDITPGPDHDLLILAGPAGGESLPPRLYQLAGPEAPPRLLDVALPEGTEGIVLGEDGALTWVTDGDGKKGRCKTPSWWGRTATILAGR